MTGPFECDRFFRKTAQFCKDRNLMTAEEKFRKFHDILAECRITETNIELAWDLAHGDSEVERIEETSPAKKLSPAEFEVARRMRDGKSNKQIADELGVKEPAVASTTQRIFRKANVSCRAAAAVFFDRNYSR